MKRDIRQLVCPTCGKAFETKNRSQVFCSFMCARAKGNGIKAKTKSINCPVCGNAFEIRLSDHRVKAGANLYCSKKCADKALMKGEEKPCPVCGKLFYTTRRKTCSVACGNIYKGQKAEHKTYIENGYVTEFKNGYNKKGNVKQHRRIMEEHIGRRLEPDEVVHHINGIKTDNRIENLQLMTRTEHSSLHRKEEKANGKHLFGGYHNN